jgi:hypothetical protein
MPPSHHGKLGVRCQVALDKTIYEHSPIFSRQGRRFDSFLHLFGYGLRLRAIGLLTCCKQQDAAYRGQQRAEKFGTACQGESPAEVTNHSINVLRRRKKKPRRLPGPIEAIFQRISITDPVT